MKHGNKDPINGFPLIDCNVGEMECWQGSAGPLSRRDRAEIPKRPRRLEVTGKSTREETNAQRVNSGKVHKVLQDFS